MKIVIAGGSGFLGSPLAEMYAEDGHDVRMLTRSLESGETRHDPGTGVPGITRVGWKADGKSGPWAAALEGADGVVNLAGESLASKRWSEASKKRFRDSRILSTRSLAEAIRAASTPPAVLISGSAVGFYGPSDERPLTESDPPAPTFSRSSARIGSRRRVRPNAPGPGSPCSAPASSSNDREAPCRK